MFEDHAKCVPFYSELLVELFSSSSDTYRDILIYVSSKVTRLVLLFLPPSFYLANLTFYRELLIK